MGESKKSNPNGIKIKGSEPTINLFSQVETNSRSVRQEEAIDKWVKAKLCGTLQLPTGFGKTRCGLLAISRFITKNPNKTVIVIVPSDPVKEQWMKELINWNIFNNCEVKTMFDAAKHEYNCTLLVIDEIHRVASNQLCKVFDNIKYSIILGLTATFERLDGRDVLISKHCPIVDVVTQEEAVANKWLSGFHEYLVLIEPPDFDVYEKLNQEFNEHFAFFEYNFPLAMNCVTSWQARANLAKERCHGDDYKEINKQILIHAMGFNRTLQGRKSYINNHPKKIELTNKILEYKSDKKCITFSATIAMAEKIKYGKVYSGKDSVKKGRITLSEFIEQPGGILNTISRVDEGLNCPDISVAVLLGINSSKTKATQRKGRVIRYQENKDAEIFTIVLKGTVEERWFKDSLTSSDYITLDEEGLDSLLRGEEYTPKKNKVTNTLFRF